MRNSLLLGVFMVLARMSKAFTASHLPSQKAHRWIPLHSFDLPLRLSKSCRPISALFLSFQPSTMDLTNFTEVGRPDLPFPKTYTVESPSISSSESINVDKMGATSLPTPQSGPPQRQSLQPIVYHMNKALIDMVYNIICTLYPVGDGTSKDISSKAFVRFYVLETVARVPYFAYLSVLHLRETFGERAYSNVEENRLRTHYAEADNELHHLLIMESLGGNSQLWDRVLAQGMAFVYYWYVVLVYSLVSSQAAYHLSELIEDHAYDTYDEFLKLYETELRTLPVPEIAKQYYLHDYPSFFPLFCTTLPDEAMNRRDAANRLPQIELNSLYDVFVCIRNDEKEHWKTLCNLVQYDHMSADHHTAAPIESTQPATAMQ